MNTPQAKRAVREREGDKCKDCGMTNEDHLPIYGRSLHVHRIVPGSAYTVEGCVLLCNPCHNAKHDRRPPRLPVRIHKVEKIKYGGTVSLPANVVENLNKFARDYTRRTGASCNRTVAIRIIVRRYIKRLCEADPAFAAKYAARLPKS